jgi:hypothetical protein
VSRIVKPLAAAGVGAAMLLAFDDPRGAGQHAGGGSLGDGADCIAYDELSSAGTPHGIPPWLAGLVGGAMFGFGAFVARRRRPQVEDVAV